MEPKEAKFGPRCANPRRHPGSPVFFANRKNVIVTARGWMCPAQQMLSGGGGGLAAAAAVSR